jgi:hypothetical protein
MILAPAPPLTRRRLLQGAASCGALALAGCGNAPLQAPAPAASARLRLLGQAVLPHGLQFRGTTVGGLSGMDYDPATGRWVAISDDRSELQAARFYTLQVDVTPASLAVQVVDVTTLRAADGLPYPPRATRGQVVDPEAIRLLPAGAGVLWASEGDEPAGQSPAVRVSRLDGTYVRDFEIPQALQFSRPGRGPRPNLTFEGLALTPDARIAWVAMENALQQDGPVPGVGKPGGPCRFTAFDVASGRALRQIAYLPDAVPHAPAIPGGFTDNGVSEILMMDATRMLVLERAFMQGVGTSLRIYEIDTQPASDTLAVARLEPGAYRPAAKRLVADFADLGLSRLDNTEGMCWGPRLPDGSRSLVVVSDDNFSRRQITQFAAFAYLETP